MAKKLLYIVNDADYFVSHRLDLAKAAQQNGYLVTVATRKASQHPVIKNSGFTCIDIPITRGGDGWLSDLWALISLILLFARHHFDLVHVITLKTTLLAGIAGRLTRQRNMVFAITGLGYIFTEDNPKMETIRKIFIPVLRFAMGGRNSCSIFQNPDDIWLFEKLNIIPSGHSTLIKGSGVDLKNFIPLPEPPAEEPVTVLFPARLLGHKGLNEFVEAARHFRGKAVFALAGNVDPDNPSAVPVQQIKTWEKSEIIQWWGHMTDIREAFKKCHIVCLPSYREGLPKALIEAAACARPIVTTDIPGCREVVHDGTNGFCVPVKAAPPLIDALDTLIHNQEMRITMGESGRQIVEKELSLERVISETLKLYGEHD